jgi:hypothetical protein
MRRSIAVLPMFSLLAACGTDPLQPVNARVLAPSAVAAQGADKYDLIGPEANVFCVSLTPVPGENVSLFQEGFAVFNANNAGTISAVVSLKGAAPNTDYPVRLIQGGGADCHIVDGILTTNGQGNGTLRVAEDANGSGRAQVIIDTGRSVATPTYRATNIFIY